MLPLFTVASKQKKRGIVFLRKEFEARNIVEGVDWVFLGESNAKWTFECIQIRKKIIDQRRRACASEEKRGLGIFVDQWFALGEFSF